MIRAKLRIAGDHNAAELRGEFNGLARRHYGDGTLADLARRLVAVAPAPLLAGLAALYRQGRRLKPGRGAPQ